MGQGLGRFGTPRRLEWSKSKVNTKEILENKDPFSPVVFSDANRT